MSSNPYSNEVGDGDDQEVVIDSSGRAVINGQEIIEEDDIHSKRTGFCPTWLSDASPRMKCLLSTATILFVAFVAMAVAGVIGTSNNNEKGYESAQYQEAIEGDSTNAAATNPPPSRPSAQNEILTVPTGSSQILIAFPNVFETKLKQIDFSDGLGSSEQTQWNTIQTSIEDTIAITLLGELPDEYEVGTIEIESIDYNAISGGGDPSSYTDTIHAIVYSSSVIVDCVLSDCSSAPGVVEKAVASVGQMNAIDAAGDFAVATTAAPVVTTDSSDNIDSVDEVDGTVDQVDAAATTTSIQASVDQVDAVDVVDTAVAETGSPTVAPAKSPVSTAPVTAAPTYPPTAGGPIPLDDASCSSSSPCSECLGACSSDSDCADDLLCFKRLYWDNIPGCEGPGTQGMSYCYDPYAEGLTKDVLLSDKDSKCGEDGSKCGKCQGK
jgi:hypothetical protein